MDRTYERDGFRVAETNVLPLVRVPSQRHRFRLTLSYIRAGRVLYVSPNPNNESKKVLRIGRLGGLGCLMTVSSKL